MVSFMHCLLFLIIHVETDCLIKDAVVYIFMQEANVMSGRI